MNIGVFDSGKGGKLIANKISQALPGAKVVFFADKKYFPYGNKPAAVIHQRLVYFTQKFQALNCRMIVIACNTATTNVIKKLRQQFPKIIFTGVEPPIKYLSAHTKTGRVAIMGTRSTINSPRRKKLQQQFAHNLQVFNLACDGLAEAIEKNSKPNLQTKKLLKKYLDFPIQSGVDAVGIACTHYPYVQSQMKQLYPGVEFYDPADAVVAQAVKIYNENHDSMGKV